MMGRQTLLLYSTATRAFGPAKALAAGGLGCRAACCIAGLYEECIWCRGDPASLSCFDGLADALVCSRQWPHQGSAGVTSVAPQPTPVHHVQRQLVSLRHNYLQQQNTTQWDQQRSFASQSHTDRRDVNSARHRSSTDAATAAAPAGQSKAHATSGWTRQEVWNAPNAISLARLLSGPIIASWIIAGKTDTALIGLTISGWSDWLDGYVARRFKQESIIGTYLDPLADKVLICSVVAALGIQGTLPGYLAVVIIGRDLFLISATFAARASQLGWRRVSVSEFFRIARQGQQALAVTGSSGSKEEEGAQKVTPLYVSKVNTVLQLATVAGFLLHAYAGWPPTAALDVAAIATAGTTILSGAAYIYKGSPDKT